MGTATERMPLSLRDASTWSIPWKSRQKFNKSDVISPTAESRRHSLWGLVVALALYLGLGIPAALAQLNQINLDAVAYFRHALYLSQGDFATSVSGYWSPLLTWCLAPFIGLGMDSVAAARLVLGLWGMALVIVSWLFLRKFAAIHPAMQFVILVLIALQAIGWSVGIIAPDVILSTLLLAYGTCTVSPGFATNRRLQIIAGLLAALAYLAKSYALPFFLAHHSFVVILHWWKERISWQAAAKMWLTGFLAFLVLAGPWIVVLSVKYGHLTFSTVGRVAHSIVGPPDMPRGHPNEQLRDPPEGRVTVWEVPEVLPYNHWSPFQSMSYFKHQAALIVDNATRIIRTINEFDWFHSLPGGLLLVALFLWALEGRRFGFQGFWIFGTVGIYAGGFLPIHYEARYLNPMVYPLCVVYFFLGLDHARKTFWSRENQTRLADCASAALTAVVILSFLYPAFHEAGTLIRKPSSSLWRRVADRLERDQDRGAIAATSNLKLVGTFAAYEADRQFAGVISGASVEEIEESLARHRVTVILAPPYWELADHFRARAPWRLDTALTGGKQRVEIYRREPGPTSSEP